MIPVFYRPEMAASSASFSPSSRGPVAAVADWLAHGLGIEVRSFDPATEAQVKRAHASDYVDGIMRCELPNGFGNRSREVADSLPYTVGSMVAAARHVMKHGGIACSPSGGFHRARHEEPGEGCTFNGLMVAALDVLSRDPYARIEILDFDMRSGDGTVDIIGAKRPSGYVRNLSTAAEFEAGMGSFLMNRLPLIVQRVRDRGADLVLYQASAGQHIDNPSGGLFTTEEMRYRDECVFQSFAQWGVPVVFNLAGDFQTERDEAVGAVLALFRQTVQEAIKAGGMCLR